MGCVNLGVDGRFLGMRYTEVRLRSKKELAF